MSPRVLIIDMDGTMIGNITPQLCEYTLLIMTYQKNKMKDLKRTIVRHLREGVMRPGLTQFLEHVKNSDMEAFVYTASDDRWAKFMVPCIEEATGFRFNRPLFTRKHCTQVGHGSTVDYRKSLARISPHIRRALKTNMNTHDVVENAILIDNKADVLLHPDRESHRHVTFPTYNATFYYDVLANIELPVLTKNMPQISDTLECHGLFPSSKKNGRVSTSTAEAPTLGPFYLDFFSALRDRMRESYRETETHWKDDRLWHVLRSALSEKVKTHRFSARVVGILNSRVQNGGISTADGPHIATGPVAHCMKQRFFFRGSRSRSPTALKKETLTKM